MSQEENNQPEAEPLGHPICKEVRAGLDKTFSQHVLDMFEEEWRKHQNQKCC